MLVFVRKTGIFLCIFVENTKEKSGLHPPMPWIRMSGTQGG